MKQLFKNLGVRFGVIDETPKKERKPITTTQVVITVFYCLSYVLANITVIRLIPGPWGLIMAGSTFIYPLTYIFSDIFSEVYGYAWSRKANLLSFACNLFVVLMVMIIIYMPLPADGLVDGEAFKTVFAVIPRIFLASAVAYLVGDWIDDVVFAKMKKKHKDTTKGFKWRAAVSSFFSTIFDISLFYLIALTGILPTSVLITLMTTDFLTKLVLEQGILLHISAPIVKKIHAIENK